MGGIDLFISFIMGLVLGVIFGTGLKEIDADDDLVKSLKDYGCEPSFALQILKTIKTHIKTKH